ncbi:leishmanolysin family protein (macronuclear) [Tetrahymena thermophila SB210]|uniref:Leishmanolysin family protein n=1 Tax=Tetrahymena thermophila (strain SB210) TaxID=312017 RepID=I7MM58_TETTS|nr:leishmanolysin family protein [Tetrahymena thermophila SB210]EAS04215.2 leishmanolysin family protein [Tetrahymena thermophila SB210]|eukprot:XP_001024460.2 leishmanolysin family protein [Tetrahymena thermophila SB210]
MRKILLLISTMLLLIFEQSTLVQCATGQIKISFNWSAFINPADAPNTQQYDLIKKAIQNASYFFSEIVQVNSETSPLTFTIQNGINNCSPQATNGYVTPTTTDLHIFVKSYENVSGTEIMNGKFCTIASYSRPKFGIIQMNFAKIDHPTMNTDSQNQRHLMYYRLAQKSIQSILGFDNDLFSYFLKSPGVYYAYTEVVLTVSTKTYITLQPFLTYAGSYYQNYRFANQLGIQFQVLNGVTVWSKRYLYNDVSTANTALNFYIDKLYSYANALLLQQTGWYTNINTGRVDINDWGQSFNSFLDSGDINTCSPSISDCSQTYMAIANCTSDIYIQNNLAEVPYVSCTDKTYGINLPIQYQRGQIYDEKSKCFTSSITNTVYSTQIPFSCHEYVCDMAQLTLTITIVGAQNVICTPTLSGQVQNLVTLTNVQGTITCPNFYSFCQLTYACPKDCSTNGYCSRGMCTCNSGYSGYGCDSLSPIVDQNEIPSAKCDIANGYYLAPNNVCLLCTDPCTQCFNQGNGYCTACKAGYYLLGNTCVNSCPDGYYLGTQNGQTVCLICAISCKKCSGTATNCQNCPTGQYQMPDTTCVVSCTPTSSYYQNSQTMKCDPCDISCNQCTAGNSDTSCVKCANAGQFKDPTNQNRCGTCPPGTYGDTVSGSCQPCTSPCATCVTSSTTCTSCQTGSLKPDGTCGQCDPGWFSSSGICKQCDPNCLTCSGSSKNCTSCSNGAVLPDNTCPPCTIGYYYNGSTCVQCHPSCYKCNGQNNNNCTACSLPNYLRLDGTCGACNSNQYVDQNGSCQNCDPSCLTCSKAGNTGCTKCSTPGQYLTQPSLVCGNCTSSQYADPVDQKCKPCDASCLTCSAAGPTNCIACNNPAYFKDHATQLCGPCQQYYYGSTTTGYCEQCDSSCQTCHDSGPTNCIICKNPMAKLNTGLCGLCGSNQYIDNNNTCQNCDPSCATCVGGSDPSQCTKCNTPGYYLSQNTPPGKCGPCTAQQYGDPVSNLCKPCDASCNGCTAGTASDCKNCANPLYFKNPLNQNICGPCPSNYFGNTLTGFCQPCDITCLTCKNGSPQGCVTCPPGQFLKPDQSCGSCLSNQYVQNGNSCQNCDPTCATCKGPGNNQCTSCATQGNYLTNPNLTCGPCQTQEYGDPSTNKCTPCDSTCNQCTGSGKGNCIHCADPSKFKDPQNNNYCQQCTPGSYGDTVSGFCKPCDKGCSTCIVSSDNCTSCQNNYYLYNGQKCVQNCPNGTYPVGPPSNICKACEDTNCVICTAPNKCTQCQSPYLNQGNTCVKNCSPGYYQPNPTTCLPCDPSCQLCGPTTSQCIQCPPNLYIQGSKCVSQCDDGYYLNINQKQCLPCQIQNCSTCTSQQNCATCQKGYELQTTPDPNNPGQKIYKCIIQCNQSCKTCILGSPSQCTSCPNGKVLQGNNCQDTCNNGFYQDPVTKNNCLQCQPNQCIQNGDQCHYTCSTCYGSGYANCLTCAANRVIQTPFAKNVGECVCPSSTTDVLVSQCEVNNSAQDQIQSASIGLFVVGTIFSVMTSIITSNPLFIFLFLDSCQNSSSFRYLDRKNGLGFDQLASNLEYSNIFTLFPTPNSWAPSILKSSFIQQNRLLRMLDLYAPNSMNQFDKQTENNKIALDGKTPYFMINMFVFLILCLTLWIIGYISHKHSSKQNLKNSTTSINKNQQQVEENNSFKSASTKQESNLIKKKSKKLAFKEKLSQYMYISIPIAFSLITIGEAFVIVFYGFFNFNNDISSIGILSNIVIFFVLGYYLFLIGYISKNFVRQRSQEENNESFKENKMKLIIFYDILEVKETKKRIFPVIYCFKKIIQALFCAVIVKNPKLQISLLIVLSFFYWLYIVVIRPFKRILYKILAITIETISLIISLVFVLMISSSDRNSKSYSTDIEVRYVYAIIALIFFILFLFIVFSMFQFLKFFISYTKKSRKVNPNSVQKITPEDFSQNQDFMSNSQIQRDNYLAGIHKDEDEKIKYWNTNRIDAFDQSNRFQSSRANFNNSNQQKSFLEFKGQDQSLNNSILNNSLNQHKLIEMHLNGYQFDKNKKIKMAQSSSSDNDNYSTDQEKGKNNSQFQNHLVQYAQHNQNKNQEKSSNLILSSEEDHYELRHSQEDKNQSNQRAQIINLDQQYDQNLSIKKPSRRIQTSNSQQQKRNKEQNQENYSYMSENNNRNLKSANPTNQEQNQHLNNNRSKHILQSIMTLTRTSGFVSDKND